MKKILFFSNNINKIKEIKYLFKKLKTDLISSKDLKIYDEPKENGNSFAENAKIKSKYSFEKTKIPSFADDSGICIEALGWKPNIFSRRFINGFKNQKDCLNYIIKKIKITNKNKAYFKTSICLTIEESSFIVFEGKVSGTISHKILGNNGFGYDPIFIPNGSIKTFAEMKNKEKNIISHRAIAINKLINFLST